MTHPSEVPSETVTAMNLPWRLEQPEKWPFDLHVVDAAGMQVLTERRQAHSTLDKTVADAMEARHFREGRDEAVSANAAQVAKLEAIVAAVNAMHLRSETVGRQQVIEAAVRDAQDVLAEYIDPSIELSDADCINRLLGILDHQDLVRAQRSLASLPKGEAQTRAATDVLAERARQVSGEGWTSEYDDDHTAGELAQAAAAYAFYCTEAENGQPPAEVLFPTTWSEEWWKPSGDARPNLVKAGALILAEIERLDRASLSKAGV